jgi:hypothetical protein
MLHWLGGLFLVVHGLIHVAIWVPRLPKDAPFDAHHSPMFGDVRGAAAALAVLAAGGFVVSGISYLAGQDWWAPAALGAAAVSIVLLILTFTPWWLLALVIDAAIALVAWRAIRS